MKPTTTELCAAGYDAVFEAGFRSGAFAEAGSLLDSAMTRTGTERDLAVEASAIDGLGQLAHYRNIAAPVNAVPVADAEVLAEEALVRRALTLRRQANRHRRGSGEFAIFGARGAPPPTQFRPAQYRLRQP
jgi:hypothetical protein